MKHERGKNIQNHSIKLRHFTSACVTAVGNQRQSHDSVNSTASTIPQHNLSLLLLINRIH